MGMYLGLKLVFPDKPFAFIFEEYKIAQNRRFYYFSINLNSENDDMNFTKF